MTNWKEMYQVQCDKNVELNKKLEDKVFIIKHLNKAFDKVVEDNKKLKNEKEMRKWQMKL